MVRGECVDGAQRVHHIAPNTCRAPLTMPQVDSIPCNAQLPFIVQVSTADILNTTYILTLFIVYLQYR